MTQPDLPAVDPLAAAQQNLRRRRRLQALYKLVLLSALSCLCFVMTRLTLDRQAAHAADRAPDFERDLNIRDPLPERLPAFDPTQVSADELQPAQPTPQPDISLSSNLPETAPHRA